MMGKEKDELISEFIIPEIRELHQRINELEDCIKKLKGLDLAIEVLKKEARNILRLNAMSGEGQEYRIRKLDSIEHALKILEAEK